MQHAPYAILLWTSGASGILLVAVLAAMTIAYFVSAGLATLRDSCATTTFAVPSPHLLWFGGSLDNRIGPRFALDASPGTGGPCLSCARANPALCSSPAPDGLPESMTTAFMPRSMTLHGLPVRSLAPQSRAAPPHPGTGMSSVPPPGVSYTAVGISPPRPLPLRVISNAPSPLVPARISPGSALTRAALYSPGQS
jgi:hypothetical protein